MLHLLYQFILREGDIIIVIHLIPSRIADKSACFVFGTFSVSCCEFTATRLFLSFLVVENNIVLQIFFRKVDMVFAISKKLLWKRKLSL